MAKVWCPAASESEYTRATIHCSEEFEGDFKRYLCMPVPGRFPKTTLTVIGDYPPADFLRMVSFFTVSSRLKDVLSGFGVRAEFFLVDVIFDGAPYTASEFYFCNILDCVDCLDLERGEYTFESKPGFTHLVHQVKRLAIDDQKAAGHELFRIANGAETIVCVSDSLATAISERRCTGVRFVTPDVWRFGMVVE